ncbi:MAG TPA: ABC transporter permease [Polyangiaceae bacterium]|nr:ABC transporter permease [Polyangiaceae bacterium]
MNAAARVARRLVASALVVWFALTVAFAIHYALPGDPARALAGPQARPADVKRLRAQLGLDRPLAAQYALFFRRAVHRGEPTIARGDREHAGCVAFGRAHVDLGYSLQRRKPVVALVLERWPASLLLAACALAVQVLAGSAAGLTAALARGGRLDHGAIAATLLGVSVPPYLLGLGLQYLLAYRLRWVPLDGYGETWGERLAHVALPALTLGAYGAALYARLVRDAVRTHLRLDHVRAAFARGGSRARVIGFHVLRNASLPLVALVGLDAGALMAGALVTEKLFRWPGLGQLTVDAVLDRDGPVVLGCVLAGSIAVVAANLAADAAKALLDPRLRRP